MLQRTACTATVASTGSSGEQLRSSSTATRQYRRRSQTQTRRKDFKRGQRSSQRGAMDLAEQQYQRDIARIEAHKLALKDDEFGRLVEQVRQEVRAHTRYHQQRGAAITLNDRD